MCVFGFWVVPVVIPNISMRSSLYMIIVLISEMTAEYWRCSKLPDVISVIEI